MTTITLVNNAPQQLSVDQWSIPQGGRQPVPAISPNMIAAKNAGLISIVTTNDGQDSAVLFNPVGNNTLLSGETVAAVTGALASSAAGVLGLDASSGSGFVITLTGNITAVNNPTGLTAGQRLTIEFVQDATGSRTLPAKANWGSAWTFPGGTAPTLSTAANAVDKLEAFFDGLKLRVSPIQLTFS